jgi:hypothetical protein
MTLNCYVAGRWSMTTGFAKPAERSRFHREAAALARRPSAVNYFFLGDALAKLPPTAQEAWRRYWADLDALLVRVQKQP